MNSTKVTSVCGYQKLMSSWFEKKKKEHNKFLHFPLLKKSQNTEVDFTRGFVFFTERFDQWTVDKLQLKAYNGGF